MLDWIEILNKVDIVGLMEMEAPLDEYSREAALLNETAINCESVEELVKLLYSVSKNAWYSLAPDDFADYEKAADKIWPLLKAYKDFLQ